MTEPRQARITQTITIVIEKKISENDLDAYNAQTFEEAAHNDAKWLEGEEDQGDYLIMELHGENVTSVEVDTTVFEVNA